MRHVACIALIALSVLAATPTAADNKADAKLKFEAGEQAYKTGNYVIAAQAFEQAYELYPLPAIRFSWAQAQRLEYARSPQDSWRIAAALELYKQYVAEQKKGGRVMDATEFISSLEPLVRVLTPEQKKRPSLKPPTIVILTSSAEGASVLWNGQAEELPFSASNVPPGDLQLEVSARGYSPESVKIQVLEGTVNNRDIQLKAKPFRLKAPTTSKLAVHINGRRTEPALDGFVYVEPGQHDVAFSAPGREPLLISENFTRDGTLDASRPLPTTGRRKVATAMLWSGGVLAAGAIGLGAAAFLQQGKVDDLEERRNSGSITQDEFDSMESHLDKRDNFRRFAIISAVAAGVAGGVGLALYVGDHKQPERRYGTMITPAVTGDAIGAQMSGTF